MSGQLILAAAVGASLGSFVNVLIARFGQPKARLTDRSRCPNCRANLRWWELIPILSYLGLRARCAHCHVSISWQYPIIEAVTAAAWVWAAVTYSSNLFAAITLAGILTLVILLWAIDARYLLLPDVYIVCLAVLVMLHLWVSSPHPPLNTLLGGFIGSGFLLGIWAATRGTGLGFGDVKLMLPLGLLLGLEATVTALFIAFMAGGAVAAYLLLRRTATLKTAVPFGPYLLAAAAVVLIEPRLTSLLFGLMFA